MRRLLMTTLIVAILFGESEPAAADRAKARDLVRQGTISAENGQAEEALSFYQRAIRSDPDYVQSYELALPLWLRAGHEAEARKHLELLTLRCPRCAFAWYALGALYRRDQRYDLALLAYDAYLGSRPRDLDGHFGLAMALVALKDPRALGTLERYLELEHRPERRAYREQALRLLAAEHGAANPPSLPGPARLVLLYLKRIRPWVDLVWRQASGVGDDGDRGSLPGTKPATRPPLW